MNSRATAGISLPQDQVPSIGLSRVAARELKSWEAAQGKKQCALKHARCKRFPEITDN